MVSFAILVAGLVVRVEALFGSTREYCRAYWTELEPECMVAVSREDLVREQELLDLEAAEVGLKKRRFPEPFLERAVIQRRIAQKLVERDTLLMHGSTVAVDGYAYLFTAACGTGKSTHTRLWREVFGKRAVMVNDDKPFLHVRTDRVLAYGSPWTGKHGRGENVCFPLAGICVLQRGPENRIRRAETSEVIGMLRHQCVLPGEQSLPVRATELVEQLAGIVPLWIMECTKEPQAAAVAYAAMSSK